jgi:hypothetical protein
VLEDAQEPGQRELAVRAVRLRVEVVHRDLEAKAAGFAATEDAAGDVHQRLRVRGGRGRDDGASSSSVMIMRAVLYERTSGWSSKASEVELKGIAGGD